MIEDVYLQSWEWELGEKIFFFHALGMSWVFEWWVLRWLGSRGRGGGCGHWRVWFVSGEWQMRCTWLDKLYESLSIDSGGDRYLKRSTWPLCDPFDRKKFELSNTGLLLSGPVWIFYKYAVCETQYDQLFFSTLAFVRSITRMGLQTSGLTLQTKAVECHYLSFVIISWGIEHGRQECL